MVIGEGFVNHQEHNAGEEGQSQDDQNGDLEDIDGQPGSVHETLWSHASQGNP